MMWDMLISYFLNTTGVTGIVQIRQHGHFPHHGPHSHSLLLSTISFSYLFIQRHLSSTHHPDPCDTCHIPKVNQDGRVGGSLLRPGELPTVPARLDVLGQGRGVSCILKADVVGCYCCGVGQQPYPSCTGSCKWNENG